jgi:hypothetical protein
LLAEHVCHLLQDLHGNRAKVLNIGLQTSAFQNDGHPVVLMAAWGQAVLILRYVFRAATTHLGVYSDSVPDAAYQYPSSGYLDDLAWGAAWLYAARQNPAYLGEASSYFTMATANRTAANPMVFNWDNVLPGTAVLMSNLTKTAAPYQSEVRIVLLASQCLFC